MMINELCKQAYENSMSKGFWSPLRTEEAENIPQKIALIHAEASEALEADRAHQYCRVADMEMMILSFSVKELFIEQYKEHVKGTFEEEMADICIRVFDLCGRKNIDLAGHIAAKMRYNSYREHKHGKKY